MDSSQDAMSAIMAVQVIDISAVLTVNSARDTRKECGQQPVQSCKVSGVHYRGPHLAKYVVKLPVRGRVLAFPFSDCDDFNFLTLQSLAEVCKPIDTNDRMPKLFSRHVIDQSQQPGFHASQVQPVDYVRN
jgi:hypothetical protein